MEADETGTLAALRERRKGIVEPPVRENDGRTVKFTGDGVLAEFAGAVNALKCALDVQKRMAESNEILADPLRGHSLSTGPGRKFMLPGRRAADPLRLLPPRRWKA
jgi:class 3 adenylate cyclase